MSNSVALLLDLTARINSTTGTKDLLNEIIEGAKEIIEAEASSLILFDEKTGHLVINMPTGEAKDRISGERIPADKGIAGWVLQNNAPIIVNDAQSDHRFLGDIAPPFKTRNLIGVPLTGSNQQALGVLEGINKKGSGKFSSIDVAMLEALAHQAAIAIEREKLHRLAIERQRETLRKEVEMERARRSYEQQAAKAFTLGIEKERRRIASELHDDILGNLSGILRKVQRSMRQPVDEGRDLSELLSELDTLGHDIRSIMDNLTPSTLAYFGLPEALEMMVQKNVESAEEYIDLAIHMDLNGGEFDEYDQISIYRIFQEGTANAIKHGKPSTMNLSVTKSVGHIEIALRDNGTGFDVQDALSAAKTRKDKGGNGLLNMIHRASTIGADLRWEKGADGQGTVMKLTVPQNHT